MVDRSKLSPDQPLVPGADVIYPPAGQAGEYAPLATNPWKGCGHKCAYCYVPLATHQPRAEFDAGAVPRPGYMERLLRDAKRYQRAGVTDQVMLSFATDPYAPGVEHLTRPVLEVIAEHGMAFCTLTKAGGRALRDISIFRPDRDAFACTLTTLDDAFSRKWERGAALPADRINALLQFHNQGIFTWVSLEPTLDVEASLAIVERTHRFVDLFKIGRANYLQEITRTTDWRDYTLRMVDLCQRLGVRHYIKRDLQAYLSPGYPNPLRVQQHH
jgi:DNA repair photolyase